MPVEGSGTASTHAPLSARKEREPDRVEAGGRGRVGDGQRGAVPGQGREVRLQPFGPVASVEPHHRHGQPAVRPDDGERGPLHRPELWDGIVRPGARTRGQHVGPEVRSFGRRALGRTRLGRPPEPCLVHDRSNGGRAGRGRRVVADAHHLDRQARIRRPRGLEQRQRPPPDRPLRGLLQHRPPRRGRANRAQTNAPHAQLRVGGTRPRREHAPLGPGRGPEHGPDLEGDRVPGSVRHRDERGRLEEPRPEQLPVPSAPLHLGVLGRVAAGQDGGRALEQVGGGGPGRAALQCPEQEGGERAVDDLALGVLEGLLLGPARRQQDPPVPDGQPPARPATGRRRGDRPAGVVRRDAHGLERALVGRDVPGRQPEAEVADDGPRVAAVEHERDIGRHGGHRGQPGVDLVVGEVAVGVRAAPAVAGDDRLVQPIPLGQVGARRIDRALRPMPAVVEDDHVVRLHLAGQRGERRPDAGLRGVPVGQHGDPLGGEAEPRPEHGGHRGHVVHAALQLVGGEQRVPVDADQQRPPPPAVLGRAHHAGLSITGRRPARPSFGPRPFSDPSPNGEPSLIARPAGPRRRPRDTRSCTETTGAASCFPRPR